jgi:hypothetical protein
MAKLTPLRGGKLKEMKLDMGERKLTEARLTQTKNAGGKCRAKGKQGNKNHTKRLPV